MAKAPDTLPRSAYPSESKNKNKDKDEFRASKMFRLDTESD